MSNYHRYIRFLSSDDRNIPNFNFIGPNSHKSTCGPQVCTGSFYSHIHVTVYWKARYTQFQGLGTNLKFSEKSTCRPSRAQHIDLLMPYPCFWRLKILIYSISWPLDKFGICWEIDVQIFKNIFYDFCIALRSTC